MDNNILISIITVCYNSKKTINDTMASVLNQTYKNIEYIIIDGGSKDGTIDIVKEYEPKFNGRLKWISEPDKGIYDAMNKGIQMAKGDFIGIINSDDWYEVNAISSIIKQINNSTEIIYGNIIKINCKNEYFIDRASLITNNRGKFNFKNFNIPHPAAFVKREIYEEMGYYDSKLKIASDYKFFLNAAISGKKFNYLDETIAYFREGGTSSNYSQSMKECFIIDLQAGRNILEAVGYYSTLWIKVFMTNIMKKNKVLNKILVRYAKSKKKEI